MFKQALNTSSRALRSSSRLAVRTPAVRTQFASAPKASFRPAFAPHTRWYSEQADSAAKKEGEEAKPQETSKDEGAKGESDVVAELKKKLEAKDKEVVDWKDKAMRTVADFRNLQDRTTREMKSARDFAIQKFAKDLVDTVDNLDRALVMGQEKLKSAEGAEKNADLEAFYEGVKMTETNMHSTLKKHGLEFFDPAGEKFNPNEHEATFMTPQPDKEDNTVFFVQQKGFKLNGRVLRAAKVGVVKNA